jgi:hypothetical protein
MGLETTEIPGSGGQLMYKSAVRGKEIEQWLLDNEEEHGRPHFVIVDDEANMAHLKKKTVWTNRDVGLTAAKADALIARFLF